MHINESIDWQVELKHMVYCVVVIAVLDQMRLCVRDTKRKTERQGCGSDCYFTVRGDQVRYLLRKVWTSSGL